MAEGETFRATIIGELADRTAVVFDFGYMDSSSGSGHIDTGTAAGDFQTLVQAKIVAALPLDYKVTRYRFACVGGLAKGEVGYVDVTPPVSGALTSGNRLPNEVAVSLKRNTGHAGRGDRGRVFFGPVSADIVSDVNEVDTTSPSLIAVRDLLKTNLTTSTRILRPVLLKPDGSSNGRLIVNVAIARVFVHRRTRRPRTGS